MTHRKLTRRTVLRHSALAGIAVWTGGRIGLGQQKSPNEKLHIAGIGIGGRGVNDINACAGENIVALCDVDQRRAWPSFVRFPRVQRFKDFRRMFDKLDRQIDAVVVATPDHTHAVAAMAAMRRGKHCYCEKPLTHNVYEARLMAETAAKHKLATQMGTQIHAGENYRRVVELIRSGAIGPVSEVHAWLGARFNGPPMPDNIHQRDLPEDTPPVPQGLDWDLWLGPAPFRPYHPLYVPAGWRFWWAFANGMLGDFFCHYCDLAFWALDLKHPLVIEAFGPLHPESTPRWTVARQEYPGRGEQPPVVLHWYHGGAYPRLAKHLGVTDWGNAVLFVGSEGQLIADYGRHKLLPEQKYAGFQPPEPSIPASIGHHQEWIRACKTGEPTTCHFGYAGPLTEAALLCNVALRCGRKIQWNAQQLKAVDCPEAQQFLRRKYRTGWSL